MNSGASLRQASPQGFPKTARLLKSKDFRLKSCRKYRTELFTFLSSREGSGRLGVSISKRVLKQAAARNRVRRLLREVFRELRRDLTHFDLHVVGNDGLKGSWGSLDKEQVEVFFQRWLKSTRT